MPVVPVADAQVRYDVTGTAPGVPLLLLHGTGSAGSALTWGRAAPRFAASRTVLTPDLSGTDRTTDAGGPLTVEGLAAQVIAVIEHAGRGPVDLLGFSMGAPVSAAVAALRPDLVNRLVLVAGWARTADDEHLRNLFTLWRTIGRELPDSDAFGRHVILAGFSRGYLNEIGREQVEQFIPSLPPTPGTMRHVDLDLTLDVRALLPRITAPVLVLGGTQDATVPVGHSRALAAALPSAPYVRYAEVDAGHVLFFEREDEFTALVEGFLEEDGSTGNSRAERVAGGAA
ncbi:alpha/beta fold hydrolase [Kitasatospora sp. NPDC051853]|uniref:alpha/beta fold hydrolase n=1 Tax=Kitasatospora sp. NPDC051853 TaxID=3364058 RepID=UPI0037AEB4C0